MNSNPASPLGPVVGTFKSSQANLVAGVIIGLFLLVFAGGLIARAPLQEPKAISFQYVVGFACVLGGLMFLAYTVDLAYTRVDLCEAGFRYSSFGSVNEVTWDEVEVIQFHASGKNDLGAHVDPYVTVLTERGTTYCFTDNTVTSIAVFVKVLSQLTSKEDNLWEVISKPSDRWVQTPRRRRNRKQPINSTVAIPLPASTTLGTNESTHVPPATPLMHNTSEPADLARHVSRVAMTSLAELFRVKGDIVEQDGSWVTLPQWNARFRCQTIPGETPCVGPTIVIGVVAEVPDLTATPIIVYQLGAGSLCSTHGFTEAIHNAVSQWHTSVWPALLNVLRVLRGEVIQPQSEWFQSQNSGDSEGDVFKFQAFAGPLLVNSSYEGSPDVAIQALGSGLQTWGLCHRVVQPLVTNEAERERNQGIWWVKVYLGRDFGEVFGEVKFNNEDSWDGLRTLEQFPWPKEIQGTMTFKQFFVVVRGKGELIPEPQSLASPSSDTEPTR